MQRVASPRLTEAANQRIVVCVEKEQARTPRAHRRIDRGNRVAQRRAAADVDRHRDVCHAGAFEGGEGRLNRNGRNVLDAVKAQVLKGFDCLALASAGQACDEDGAHEALFARAGKRPHSKASAVDRGVAGKAARPGDQTVGTWYPPSGRRAEPIAAGRRTIAVPPPRFGELKSEIVRLIHRIEGMGCLVKDLDLGLIDFPASIDSEEVYLCWKAGEPAVTHWHRVDEGFATRRPL